MMVNDIGPVLRVAGRVRVQASFDATGSLEESRPLPIGRYVKDRHINGKIYYRWDGWE